MVTVRPVLSSHLKIDKTEVLKPYGSLMQVKSTAECSMGALGNTFDLRSWKPTVLVFFDWLKTGFTVLCYYEVCITQSSADEK